MSDFSFVVNNNVGGRKCWMIVQIFAFGSGVVRKDHLQFSLFLQKQQMVFGEFFLFNLLTFYFKGNNNNVDIGNIFSS